MTIEKVGNRYRITKMRNGVRYRVSVDYKPTKKEAEIIIDERIQKENPAGDRRDTFEKSAEKYLLIKQNVLSPSTIRGYRVIIRSLSDRFKNTKTLNISQELIQKEVNDYSAYHSAKSTANLHGFISAVLGVYYPSLRISTTLPQKRKYEAVTPLEEHVEKVLTEVSGTDYEIPYRLGVYGMRRGEICAITAADLDGNILSINKSKVLNDKNEWVIKPFPKTTDSERQIYIDDHLAELIREHGTAFDDHPNRLNHHLHSLLKRLDIPAFRFHDLRAYYVSMAHSMGIPDKYIMAHGGFASTNIMNRVYKRAFADKQREMDENLGKFLGKFWVKSLKIIKPVSIYHPSADSASMYFPALCRYKMVRR